MTTPEPAGRDEQTPSPATDLGTEPEAAEVTTADAVPAADTVPEPTSETVPGDPAAPQHESVPQHEPVPQDDLDREPVVHEEQVNVVIQRSVRYSRLLIGGAIVGIVVFALISLMFPITEDSDYTMGQVAGFMALIGGAIGLAFGGVFGLVLGALTKKQRGTGVATQVDVR